MTFFILNFLPFYSQFQLTSSRRGWRNDGRSCSWRIYFNSHPHEEDDGKTVPAAQRGGKISTHILTKRMTRTARTIWGGWTISTHILTKRMTVGRISGSIPANIFQLTPSRRGWRRLRAVGGIMQGISTHILTKRMTASRQRLMWRKFYFNSHPHEEDDSFGFSIPH